MRAELPWNVAGIPPEAREAARAAARREGLSVGEWLTRRILRSFSGMEEELAPMAYENRAPVGAALDSWGLPPSAVSRRETEEIIARVGRSENESNEAWRRIEDQLRGLSRRLDTSERSNGESSRVLSHAAKEMNTAAREQAEAFDQLGVTVSALNERLARLERTAAHDGMREAVKALHQGLSRLADQLTATANNSAGQVVTLTSNLEQLAGRVGQARIDSEQADRALERHINETAAEMADRLEAIDHAVDARLSSLDPRISAMDTRLAAVEKSAQFNTNALDHALEKIEASANQRAGDQVENQKRVSRHEESLHRLEDSIARLEMRLPDAEFERRLGGIEHSVGGMAVQLKEFGSFESFDATLKIISDRLDAMERDHGDLLAELRARGAGVVEPPPYAPPSHEPPALEELPVETAPHAFELPPYAEQPPVHEPPAAEAVLAEPAIAEQAMAEQDVAEPESVEPEMAEPVMVEAESVEPEMAEPVMAEPEMAEPELTEPASPADFGDDDAAYVFADAKPHGFAFDNPPDNPDPFAIPEFEDVFAAEPETENFLAQARRSARAASQKAEAEGRSRFSGFRWGEEAPAGAEEKPRPRYLLIALLAMLVVAVAAAALILKQRARHSDMAATTVTRPAAVQRPTRPVPAAPRNLDAQFAATPQAGSQQGAETNFDTQRSAPDSRDPGSSDTARQANAATHGAMPANPAAQAAKTAAPAANDKLAQLANAGNSNALTILGLRDLDGPKGAPVNLPDAVKYLSQAADKGQAVAQYRLGTLYERGLGVATDPAKAAHWYELSANQGNRKAMHNLAVSYVSGAAGKKDMAEAARWFAKAAALGLSDSQFNLAILYERGDGVPQSLLDAYKWYSIAAAAGDSESKQRMGVLQTQLSDTDKAAAGKSAAGFHATPLNRPANVPPEPADLGL